MEILERKLLISPKQLTIIEIPVRLACELNYRWHSVLPIIHWSNVVRNKYYVCYGAYSQYIDNWKAVGIWSSPIASNRMKDGDRILELRRFAIAPDAPKYTATWMLAQMIKRIKQKFPDIIKLISYQDISIHKGIIYKAGNCKPEKLVRYQSWNKTRKRNPAQTQGDKIRWVYLL